MNAKKELEQKLNKINLAIDWAVINFKARRIILKRGFNKEDFRNFLNSLDFDYDAGYGSQYLFGNVVFENKTWLSREEYDGSEWWEYKRCPEIPVQCQNKG